MGTGRTRAGRPLCAAAGIPGPLRGSARAVPAGLLPAPGLLPVAPPASATHLGLGLKIGNGLGVIGGDLIVSPIPHVVLDLQANTLSANTDMGTATGFGLAPALQFDIREPGRSTPYVGVGYVYARLSVEDASGWASGVFINAGYEWKWSFGMGLILGGGVAYLGEIKGNNAGTTFSKPSQILPNLEFGIRFMFL
jgi:hypothetical protein